MKQSVLIIGGGIGGLVCGAILSTEGYRVRVIEKHTTAGGGLHTFSRHGVEFETGMHVISGFEEGGVLRRLCNYLGIMDKLHIRPADPEGFEHLYIASDGAHYRMASGREAFIDGLAESFPAQRENIARYVERVYEVCDQVALFNLRMPTAGIYGLPEMSMSVGEFIASFTDDPKLQVVLAWNNALYGGDKDTTPAYIAALLTKFYIEGASRFVGGSQQMADALVGVIEAAGGEVITGNGVTFIDVEDRHIQKVVTRDGREFTADWYISAIHTSTMFSLMDLSKIQKSYYSRIDSIPNSYSSFTLYVTFKPETFPYLNHTIYELPEYDDGWKCAEYTDQTWPKGVMYLTPPTTADDRFADRMIINAVMNFDTVRRWENTTVGRRGEDYKQFKVQCEERLLDLLERRYPGFRSKVEHRFSATPLTIRDYYGAKEGAIYGTMQDCRNMAATHISIRTKVDNLLLTGQNINLHGILGVPLTSIATCGELVGMQALLDKINQK